MIFSKGSVTYYYENGVKYSVNFSALLLYSLHVLLPLYLTQMI